MRIGKIPNCKKENVATPDNANFVFLFRNLDTQELEYKKSDGTFGLVVNDNAYEGITTDATPTEIFVSGISGKRFTLGENQMIACQVFGAASREDNGNFGASGFTDGSVIAKNVNGVVTDFIGPQNRPFGGDPEASNWSIDISVNPDGSVKIVANGENGKTIKYTARVLILALNPFSEV